MVNLFNVIITCYLKECRHRENLIIQETIEKLQKEVFNSLGWVSGLIMQLTELRQQCNTFS